MARPGRVRRALSAGRRLPWRRIGVGTAIAIVLLVTVPPLRRAVSLGTSRLILWAASPITPFVPDFHRLPDTTRVLAADGSDLADLSGENGLRQIVDLDAVPPTVQRSVLAAEDADFFHHSGVNPLAIVRALVSTALGHTEGGSTITQQLAKLNYTGSQRTVFRKAREVFYATALEERYSKQDLLRRYLNQVYFGDGSYGIYAAAHSFFGVDPAQLTPGPRPGDQTAQRGPAGHAPARLAVDRRPRRRLGRTDDAGPAPASRRHPGPALRRLHQAGGGRAGRVRRHRRGPPHPSVHRRLHHRDDARPQAVRRHRGRRGLPARHPGRPDHGGGQRRPRRRGGGRPLRRPRLRRYPVRLRRRRAAPAGVGVQAVRLPRRAAGPHRPPQRLRRD